MRAGGGTCRPGPQRSALLSGRLPVDRKDAADDLGSWRRGQARRRHRRPGPRTPARPPPAVDHRAAHARQLPQGRRPGTSESGPAGRVEVLACAGARVATVLRRALRRSTVNNVKE
jgi:hypothetical protein